MLSLREEVISEILPLKMTQEMTPNDTKNNVDLNQQERNIDSVW